METKTEKVKLREYTIDSTVKNGMPDVARFTRPNGKNTSVILHVEEDYARMSKYDSNLYFNQDGYKFYISLGAENTKHYTVRIPLWEHFFELEYETFFEIILMYCLGTENGDKSLLKLFDEEMLAIELGGAQIYIFREDGKVYTGE